MYIYYGTYDVYFKGGEKMKRKLMALMLSCALFAGMGISADAATITLPGGIVFDSDYYADKYPDVAAILGRIPEVLAQHYLKYGKAEGRQPNGGSQAQAGQQGQQTANPQPLPTQDQTQVVSEVKQVLDIVNRERAANGLSALSWHDGLAQAADLRAQECTQSFSHTRPNGQSCFTVFPEGSWASGENIAAGQGSPESVMNSWMNSPGHRANILNPNYNSLGVGMVSTSTGYGIYWVQCFGKY